MFNNNSNIWVFLGISLGLRPREIPQKTQSTPPSHPKNIILSWRGGISEEQYVPRVAPRASPRVNPWERPWGNTRDIHP